MVDEKGVKTINPMLGVYEDVEEQRRQESATGNKKQNMLIYGILAVSALFLLVGAFSLMNQETVVEIQINQPTEGDYSPSKPGPSQGGGGNDRAQLPRTVFVHLFEWKWKDIERECVEWLGPKGFAAIQVSPPNEHVDQRGVNQNPWWVRYQPVSYRLDNSRSGTRGEFISMVNTCKSVGVDIYVDAVLNHMAAYSGTGSAGSSYDPGARSYPEFSGSDFNYCDPPDIQGGDYGGDAYRVRHCNLVGLPDLNQGSEYVRNKQAEYLRDLLNIGVAGFRFDASKHMEPNDIKTIIDRSGGNSYHFQEVIDYGGEAISASEYTYFSDVTEFKYAGTVGDKFNNGRLSEIYGIGESFGFLPGYSAVVFVDNHDTQRGNAQLTYRSGNKYTLANIFMLAYPYGYPKVMSSYAFNSGEFDKGPPSDNGNTKDVSCFNGEWICEHRWKEIANMVMFKNFAGSMNAYSVSNWWSNGNQAIAFSVSGDQGVAGFVALNKEGYNLDGYGFYTGLSDGQYCDIVSGDFDYNTRSCNGNVVTVSGGSIVVNVPSYYAVAIHGGAKL